MIIIGEKINTSIKAVNEAVLTENEAAIQEITAKQIEYGSNYLDVNCGTFVENEAAKMRWLINIIKKVNDIPLCIDSPNPLVVKEGLELLNTSDVIVNSITAEKERWELFEPLVTEFKTSVIALCMNDDGIPDNPEERMKIAFDIANRLSAKGVSPDRIFFDPMVKPISTNSQNAAITLEAMKSIRKEIPDAHITCGLSNISYGLPVRKLLNQAFMVSTIFAGLDAAIINPMDKRLMALVYASEALAGKDDYCMEFITKFREGYFDEL
ncbi:MAG: dihydropteroate synthase [Deltaproteobacteria bacterium]